MKTVCTLLGLSAEATEEAVHAEVARALNRVKELEGSQIESDLETYKNRFDPKQREFIKDAAGDEPGGDGGVPERTAGKSRATRARAFAQPANGAANGYGGGRVDGG